MFVWLVYIGYNQIHKELFLSLDVGGAICDEVPLEVSGTYLADKNGNWEGDKDFVYSNSLYAFQFNRLKSSLSDFAGVIDITMNEINSLSEVMKANNLALTILYWTTWTLVSSIAALDMNSSDPSSTFLHGDKNHFFYLTGTICETSLMMVCSSMDVRFV